MEGGEGRGRGGREGEGRGGKRRNREEWKDDWRKSVHLGHIGLSSKVLS